MPTVIDYSPHALEIDQVAEAAGTIVDVGPPPTVFKSNIAGTPYGVYDLGEDFRNNSPDILFVAEYVPNIGQDGQGALVAWENYPMATHYEIFRRDYVAQDDSWKRILIIDNNHLIQETARFDSYVTEVLQIHNMPAYSAILDTDTASDKISEYRIVASYYPDSARVNFFQAFQSKGLLTQVQAAKLNIFDLADNYLGTSDYAWMISLFNDGLPFFGPDAGREAAYTFLTTKTTMIYIPKDINQVVSAIQESIYFFGLKNTISNLFDKTREYGVADSFYTEALNAISEGNKHLNYITLQNALKKDYPKYAQVSTLVANNKLPTPFFYNIQYTDTTGFNSLSTLSLMFSRLNTILFATIHALTNVDLGSGS